MSVQEQWANAMREAEREKARVREIAAAARRDQAAATAYLADARTTMLTSYKYEHFCFVGRIVAFTVCSHGLAASAPVGVTSVADLPCIPRVVPAVCTACLLFGAYCSQLVMAGQMLCTY